MLNKIRREDSSLTERRVLFLWIARSLLCVVFLISGVSKLIMPERGSRMIEIVFPIGISLARAGVFIISGVEILLAIALLFRPFVRPASFIASILLFSWIVGGAWILSEELDCGCFGDLFESPVDVVFLLRNTFLLLLSLGITKEIYESADYNEET